MLEDLLEYRLLVQHRTEDTTNLIQGVKLQHAVLSFLEQGGLLDRHCRLAADGTEQRQVVHIVSALGVVALYRDYAQHLVAGDHRHAQPTTRRLPDVFPAAFSGIATAIVVDQQRLAAIYDLADKTGAELAYGPGY